MICALPVHQFLSIGPDLEKSRVLYFASVGFAMLFGAMAETRRVWPAAAAVLIFQAAALEHNLAIWRRVGELADTTCRAGAKLEGPVIGLPNVLDGIYFLHTGYPECVAMRTGHAPLAGAHVWIWNKQDRRIE
jgi:hypothetical protein